jgi:hypothetical protein
MTDSRRSVCMPLSLSLCPPASNPFSFTRRRYQTAIKLAKTRQGSNNTCSFAARGFVSWQLPFDDLREREREREREKERERRGRCDHNNNNNKRKNYLKFCFSRTRRQKQIPFFLFTNLCPPNRKRGKWSEVKWREGKGKEGKRREEAQGSCCWGWSKPQFSFGRYVGRHSLSLSLPPTYLSPPSLSLSTTYLPLSPISLSLSLALFWWLMIR